MGGRLFSLCLQSTTRLYDTVRAVSRVSTHHPSLNKMAHTRVFQQYQTHSWAQNTVTATQIAILTGNVTITDCCKLCDDSCARSSAAGNGIIGLLPDQQVFPQLQHLSFFTPSDILIYPGVPTHHLMSRILIKSINPIPLHNKPLLISNKIL